MLTKKNRIFAKEYILSHNASEAARKAGYSEKTAYSIGQRMLKHVEVGALIRELERENAARYNITRDSLVRETVALQHRTQDEKIVRDCIRLKAEITGNLKSDRPDMHITLIQAQERSILSRYGLRDKSE